MLKKLSNILLCVTFLVMLVVGCSGNQNQEPASEGQKESGEQQTVNAAADFYKGNTIHFIVPFNPGGGYDTYARLVAPYLEKETGATVIVDNLPGGGGNIGFNQIFKAEPDGLTFGVFNLLGAIPSQLTGTEGVNYDLNQVSWIARLASDPQIMVTSPNSKFTLFEDFLNAGTFRFSSTSTTGSTYVNPIAVITAFSLPAKVITGYEGSNGTDMAVMRGEVDATFGSLSSKMDPIKNNDLKPVLLISKDKVSELPDVPYGMDFAETEQAKQVVGSVSAMASAGRSVGGPPGIPEERLEFLRDAFMRALANPELLDKAEKANSPINALRGDELTQFVNEAMNVPQVLLDAL